MKKFNYKTILVWTHDKSQVLPFYHVSWGIGHVPAGIDFTYHGKRYTTMSLLNAIMRSRAECKLKLSPSSWYDMQDGCRFNKTMFIQLTKKFNH